MDERRVFSAAGHTPVPIKSAQRAIRLRSALRKQLAVMWVIDGRKTRDVIASSCHGELDPDAPGIRAGSDL